MQSQVSRTNSRLLGCAKYKYTSFVCRGKGGFFVVLRASLWYNQLDNSEFVEENMDSQELYELAMKHIYGDGVSEDNDLAFKLLNQAHEMGHIEATYNLGICYHYGFGTSIDLAKAFELYLESANAGYGKGMELVGRFYNRGIHVERNREQAKFWLAKAICSSDTDAVEEAKKELSVDV